MNQRVIKCFAQWHISRQTTNIWSLKFLAILHFHITQSSKCNLIKWKQKQLLKVLYKLGQYVCFSPVYLSCSCLFAALKDTFSLLFPFLFYTFASVRETDMEKVQGRLSLLQTLLFRKQELGRAEPLPTSRAKRRNNIGGFSCKESV